MKKIFSLMMLASAVAFASCGDDGGEEAVVDITIDPAKPEMVAAEGATVTFTLNVDGAEAKSNQDWATPTVSGKELSVVVDENTESKQRSAIITVTKGEKSAKVTIKQGYNSLVPETTDVAFGYAAGTKEIGVTASGPFTATASETWITATAKESSVEIKVSAATSNRTGTVKLAMGSLEVTINVIQSKAAYNDYIGTWDFMSASGECTLTIVAKENGTTYTATGFTQFQEFVNLPITLEYEDGNLIFAAPIHNLGKITINDADTGQPVECDITWYGWGNDGGLVPVNAQVERGYPVFIGSVINGVINIEEGEEIELVGGEMFPLVAVGFAASIPNTTSYYSLDGATFEVPITMTKAETSSMAPRNIGYAPMSTAAKRVAYRAYRLAL